MRKLCKSFLTAGDSTKMDDQFVRNITRSALSPILEIPMKNKKTAPTKLVIISVQDAIDYIHRHFLRPYEKQNENVNSMMNRLETLLKPTLRSNCVTPFANNQIINNISKKLIVNDMVICERNFLSLELP
jgi:hypothetical protein